MPPSGPRSGGQISTAVHTGWGTKFSPKKGRSSQYDLPYGLFNRDIHPAGQFTTETLFIYKKRYPTIDAINKTRGSLSTPVKYQSTIGSLSNDFGRDAFRSQQNVEHMVSHATGVDDEAKFIAEMKSLDVGGGSYRFPISIADSESGTTNELRSHIEASHSRIVSRSGLFQGLGLSDRRWQSQALGKEVFGLRWKGKDFLSDLGTNSSPRELGAGAIGDLSTVDTDMTNFFIENKATPTTTIDSDLEPVELGAYGKSDGLDNVPRTLHSVTGQTLDDQEIELQQPGQIIKNADSTVQAELEELGEIVKKVMEWGDVDPKGVSEFQDYVGQVKGISVDVEMRVQEPIGLHRTPNKDHVKFVERAFPLTTSKRNDQFLEDSFQPSLGIFPLKKRNRRIRLVPQEVPAAGLQDKEVPEVKSPPIKVLESANHLIGAEIATSKNWRAIRDSLDEKYEYLAFSNDVWTIDTTFMTPEIVQTLPLSIAQRPLLLHYAPPMIRSSDSPPDPLKGQPIDPKDDLSNDILNLLFRTYPNINTAIVSLNHTLTLLYEGTINVEFEYYNCPDEFGGLPVNYLPYVQNYTGGSRRSARSWLDGDEPPFHGKRYCNVGAKIDAEYNIEDGKTHSEAVVTGIRIRPKGATTDEHDVITTALHLLTSLASSAIQRFQSKEEDFATLDKDTMARYDFSYMGNKFGEFVEHFESDYTASRRRQVSLEHDLALIKPRPGELQNMPHLIVQDNKGNPMPMEWMDPNDTEFMTKPGTVYLLGNGPWLDASTRKLPAWMVRAPHDFEEISIKGLITGRSYQKITPDPRQSPPRMDINTRLEENIWSFQRAWVWRQGHKDDKNTLPKIYGASGCALGYTATINGVQGFRIIGFQNGALHSFQDNPDKNNDRAMLQGHFNSYQSLRLPQKLIDNWDVVWHPERPPISTLASLPTATATSEPVLDKGDVLPLTSASQNPRKRGASPMVAESPERVEVKRVKTG